ncbi:MAG: AEC family transporter [Alphaproteobacteria bacterium]
MLVVFITIAPIFALIVFGFGIRRTKLFPAEAWPPVERLTYYVLFPSLLFVNLATAKLSDLPVGGMAVSVIGTPALMAALLLLVRARLALHAPGFTSLLQGAVRFNTYLGIPLVVAFYGPETIALSALFIAFMVPFINVLCVWVLARYSGTEINALGAAKEMVHNPLIIACLAGIAINLTGLGLAEPIERFFALLGRAAPAVGLLCVGAGLDIVAARAGKMWIVLSAILKLVAMPLIAFGIAQALGVGGLAAKVLILFHALPTAPSAYILARQLGGDAQLMAGILTAQTALAVVTLPLWIAVF